LHICKCCVTAGGATVYALSHMYTSMQNIAKLLVVAALVALPSISQANVLNLVVGSQSVPVTYGTAAVTVFTASTTLTTTGGGGRDVRLALATLTGAGPNKLVTGTVCQTLPAFNTNAQLPLTVTLSNIASYVGTDNFTVTISQYNSSSGTCVGGVNDTDTDGGTLVMSKKVVTALLTNVGRVYDGTVSTGGAATGTCKFTTGQVVGADADTCTSSNVFFNTKTAGAAKTVFSTSTPTVNAYIISTTTGTGIITPKILVPALVVPVDAVEKIYDATTVATITNSFVTFAPGSVLFGDEADPVIGSGIYNTKDVGASKMLTASAITLSGTDAANYMLSTTSLSDSNGGKIVSRALKFLAVSAMKVFDSLVTSAGVVEKQGLQAGDTVTMLAQSYDTPVEGEGKTMTVNAGYVVNDGNTGLNYTVSTMATTTGVILPTTVITVLPAMSTSTPAQSKTVYATTTTGVLDMKVVPSAVCDGTVTGWVAFATSTFSAESDNGKYVCYRAINALASTSYQLSPALGIIDTTKPTIVLSTSESNPTRINPMSFTAVITDTNGTFASFDVADITVTNGTAQTLSAAVVGVGTYTYTFQVVPAAEGAVSVSVLANAFEDSALNTNTASNVVSTVYDITAPTFTITSPLGQQVKKSSDSVTVAFSTAGASVDVSMATDSSPTTTVALAGPAVFSLANLTQGALHYLKLFARDFAGNTSVPPVQAAIEVWVDDTAPAVGPAADMVVEATSALGAVVNYALPSVTDANGRPAAPALTASCMPMSGTQFALGTTTVSCSAMDEAGNLGTDAFDVVVKDTTGPVFSMIPTIATSSNIVPFSVVYAAPVAQDAVSGAITSVCTPASPALVPVGSTTVTCVATDATMNATTKTFDIFFTLSSGGGPISGSYGGGGSAPVSGGNGSGSSIPTVGSTGGGGGSGKVLGASTSTVASSTKATTTAATTTAATTTPTMGTTTPATTTPVMATTTATSTCADLITATLRRGSKGDEVKKLQVFLNKELSLSIPVTGVFGGQTFEAVKLFQTRNSVAVKGLVTGIVGPLTRPVVNARECVVQSVK
jgi:YDG domain/Putative peptidoglycan binding domain